MHSAILYINGNRETELSKVKIFDKFLIEYTINELKRLDIDNIYLVGDVDVEGVIKRDNLEETFKELHNEAGKCLLISPFYPLVDKEDYEKLLDINNNAVFVNEKEEIIPIFSINKNVLSSYDKLSYDGLKIDDKKVKRFDDFKDVVYFNEVIKTKVNNKWLDKGVIIVDPKNTIIGIDVFIDKDTYIYPYTTIGGKTFIGKNNIINQGSRLFNVMIGENNNIDESNISDSIVHNNCVVGPNAIIEENSELADNVNVGSFVKLINTRVDENSSINHLSYLADCQVGKNVLVGSGVNTINYDGRSRHNTVIKKNSTIGSNVNLIAPITIGEFTLVSAGSTVDQDVKDGDLAIARIFQQNKKGYGYKYNKED